MGFSTTRGRRLRRTGAALVGTAGLSMLFGAGVAAAAPGSLVSSFGTGGTVEGPLGPALPGPANDDSFGGGVAVAGNGDIYQVGTAYTATAGQCELYIARYLPDGSPDPSFGTNGITYVNIGAGTTPSTACPTPLGVAPILLQASAFIALAANGDPVVATDATTASGNDELAVLEFTPAGQLDTNFDSTGYYESTLGGSLAVPGGMALDASGDIVLTGTVTDAKTKAFFATRLTGSGAPDSSFGSSGLLETALAGADITEGTGVIAQSNGDLVFTVVGASTGGSIQFVLARLTASGLRDPAFGTNGTVTVASESLPIFLLLPATTVASTGGGYAVAYTSGSEQATVTSVSSSGKVDGSFGTGGAAAVSSPSMSGSIATGLVAEGDGKLLVTGLAASTGPGPVDGPFVARLNSDGSIDTGFADDGVSLNPLPATLLDTPLGVASTGDGNLVLSGAVTDICGCTESLLQEISLDTPPTLTFSYGPAQAGTPVQFVATPADADGYTLGPVSWDFGTGSFGAASGSDVTHTFSSPGTYTVRAEVTDSYGLTTVSTQTVTVAAAPTIPSGPAGGGGNSGGGGSSGGTTTITVTTPTAPPTVTPAIHPVATLRLISIKAAHGKVTVKLSCTGAACNVSSRLTTIEHLAAGKVASLSSSAHGRHTRTVTIGSLKLTLQAGATRTYTIALNATGRKLLASFDKVPAIGGFTLTNVTPAKTITHRVTVG